MGELPGYHDDTSEDEYMSYKETQPKTKTWNDTLAENLEQSKNKFSEKKEHNTEHHTMSDSDENNSLNPEEPKCDSQDFLDMSPTLL